MVKGLPSTPHDVYSEYSHACALPVWPGQHNKFNTNSNTVNTATINKLQIRANNRTAAHRGHDEREDHDGDERDQKIKHPRAVAQPESRALVHGLSAHK